MKYMQIVLGIIVTIIFYSCAPMQKTAPFPSKPFNKTIEQKEIIVDNGSFLLKNISLTQSSNPYEYILNGEVMNNTKNNWHSVIFNIELYDEAGNKLQIQKRPTFKISDIKKGQTKLIGWFKDLRTEESFFVYRSGTVVDYDITLESSYKFTYNVFAKDAFNQIAKNPSKYTGQLYAFQGKVIQASESNDKTVFQMLVKDSERDIAGESLIVSCSFPSSVAKDHYVYILGNIGDMISDKNVFGASVTSLTMNAIAIFDGSAKKVVWVKEETDKYEKWKSGELFTAETDDGLVSSGNKKP